MNLFRFVLKTDDDVFVEIFHLFNFVSAVYGFSPGPSLVRPSITTTSSNSICTVDNKDQGLGRFLLSFYPLRFDTLYNTICISSLTQHQCIFWYIIYTPHSPTLNYQHHSWSDHLSHSFMILQVCDVIPAGTGKTIIKVHKLITHFCIKHQCSCVLIATIFKIQIIALIDV